LENLPNGSRMSREIHVRFCEKLAGKFRWLTLHFEHKTDLFCLYYAHKELSIGDLVLLITFRRGCPCAKKGALI
jgi:hypothetical protein